LATEKKLGARLQSACAYLTAGGTVADIGTDHAYLPIEIIKRGLSQRAIACDINRGPIESAARNIEAAGLSDRIDTMQTDGLHGVETYRPMPDTCQIIVRGDCEGIRDIETGRVFKDKIAMPKPGHRGDATTEIDEPLEYAFPVTLYPGQFMFFEVI